jgi:hypothetical protein
VRREQFEHVIAAAANVTGHDDFVVIGSQAILGSTDNAPEQMLVSMEADLYPLHDPAAADRIDGALGDGSEFQRTYGYYAHGVGPETAKAPAGWQARLVQVRIPPRLRSRRVPVAWCLEVHDLVLSKLAAGRDRDFEYAVAAVDAGLVSGERLLALVAELPVSEQMRAHVERLVRAALERS